MDRPIDLPPLEKQNEDRGRQDTTYSQHVDDPMPASNPAGNPQHMVRVDRSQLLRNIDSLDNVDLVRLSRSSYLLHANRYNIKN